MLPATVSNICVGKTTSPKADFFEALATHYPSLNLRWLLLGEGSMEIDRPAAPSPDEENRRIILQLSESVTRLSAQGEQYAALREEIAQLRQEVASLRGGK